jgi:hypothetical protein
MRRFWIALPLLLVLLGCGSEEGFDENVDTPSAFIRIVNAIPDAPDLSATLQTQNLGNIAFGQTSGVVPILPAIDRELRIDIFDGEDTINIHTGTINVAIDALSTVVVTGTLGEPKIITVADPPPVVDNADQNSEVTFIHASQNSPSQVNIYLTTGLNEISTPVVQLDRNEASNAVSLPARIDYRLRFSDAQDSNVLWDSGSFAVSPQTRSLVILFDDFTPDPTPARILQVSTVVEAFPFEFLGSSVRFTHMNADVVSAMDFYLDGELLVPGLEFTDVSEYFEFQPGFYDLLITAANDPDNVFLQSGLLLSSGQYHTTALAGTSVDRQLRVAFDSPRRIEHRAAFAVNHFSVSLPELDVFVVPAGEDFTRFQPLQMSFGGSDAGPLLVDDYEVYVTGPGTTVVSAGPFALNLEARGVYSIYVTDTPGGGQPPVVTLGDDFPSKTPTLSDP